ncbi:MAG: Mth938-like domain-containing protein [Rhizobiaceae bacterium]
MADEKLPQGGMELRPARFPGRAPVDAYGNGGFRFADMSHQGSMLFLPSGIYAWDMQSPSSFSLTAFSRILEEADAIEVLLIGTGADLLPIAPDLRSAFREHRISADSMSTGAAVRTFNVLLAEGRAVAAALIAV